MAVLTPKSDIDNVNVFNVFNVFNAISFYYQSPSFNEVWQKQFQINIIRNVVSLLSLSLLRVPQKLTWKRQYLH